MALLMRFSRLVKADAHAVLDSLEEPDVLLKQAVRDMTEIVTNEEQQLDTLNRDLDYVERQHASVVESMADLDSELDDCFVGDREDLARVVIRRKLESEALARDLVSRRVTTENAIRDLDIRLNDHRMRLQAMRQKLDILGDQSASPASTADSCNISGVSNDDIEIALLREKQRRGLS